jgi:hypothetical protein
MVKIEGTDMINRSHKRAFSLLLLSKEHLLNGEEQLFLDKHLKTCSQCRSRFQSHARLQRDLKSRAHDTYRASAQHTIALSDIVNTVNRSRNMRKLTNIALSSARVGLVIVLLGAVLVILANVLPIQMPGIISGSETQETKTIPAAIASPRATGASQLAPTPSYKSEPLLTPSAITTPTITPVLTPAYLAKLKKLNCTPLESYFHCIDGTLNIEFEYPTSWGEIEALMEPGGYTGFSYDYFFGGRTIGEAEPLLAGGRSKDFTEGRGGMPTDFWGFTSSEGRCAEVSAFYPDVQICQEIKSDVVWMVRFPDSEHFCYRIAEDFVNEAVWQPVVRIEVNLPLNSTIHGFVFEAPFLSDPLKEQLNNDLLPLIGLGSEAGTRNCDPSNRQEFDSQVQEYVERLKVKELDDRTLENLDELMHLANSITFLRAEVIKYIVQQGDTIFGIAEKFQLKPETILLGNYETLNDDPHDLRAGMELNILPVDGVYYEWQEGDDLNAVASQFGVLPEDIIDWPGNHLNPETLGDLSKPNIEPGTMLVIPGGSRYFYLDAPPIYP